MAMDGQIMAERHEQLVADVAARLQRVCSHLSDDDFTRLVQDIARMAERFREIDADPRFWHAVEQDRR